MSKQKYVLTKIKSTTRKIPAQKVKVKTYYRNILKKTE
jgi:hypothetical protein